MLSLSGLGLSFVSLWFCSEAQGRPHGEEDSHCSNQDSGVSQLAQTWPGSSPTVPMPRFLCGSGCCVDEAGWCLALPLQRTLAPFWCPCCVFWGTQHDYSQTDHDRHLAAGSLSCLSPQAWGTVARQSRVGASTPVLPSSCSTSVRPRQGCRALPSSLQRPLLRETPLASCASCSQEEEASCWRWDPTSLPHGRGGRVLVNRSLCWQRSTVSQLLAQPVFAKERQEFPCSQAGISEQDVSQILLVSSWLLCSVLLTSSQASPPCHRALHRQHTYSHSHIVFCRLCSPRGPLARHSPSPQEASSNIALPNHWLSPRKQSSGQETERDTTHECCPVPGPGVTSPLLSHSLAPR